ncbi:hypothetical protein GEMRC1_004643 [Eukaryota sp. GEM-RC1]
MYGHSSSLIFHEHTISSTRGVKQGDPLGPFSFLFPVGKKSLQTLKRIPRIKVELHSPCLCGRSKASNFHHLVNCHQFIHFRSIIHNSIRNTCLDTFKANGFHGTIETLLANLSDQPKKSRRSRGDLIGPWLSCPEIIMDFTTVDPCNSRSISKNFDDDLSALEVAEKEKIQSTVT